MNVWSYLLHWRPTFWEDRTEPEGRILAAHDLYMARLAAEGRLIFAGPVIRPPLAVVVFDARDEAEAREVMQADPCVAAAIVPATLSPFFVGYMRGGPAFDHRQRTQAPD